MCSAGSVMGFKITGTPAGHVEASVRAELGHVEAFISVVQELGLPWGAG